MAVDACSESSPNTSPRISFSLDLHNTNPDFPNQTVPSSSSSPLDSFSGFDFFFENCIDIEPSSADELFSHGLIRPKQIEPKLAALSRQSSSANSKKTASIQNCMDFEDSKSEESMKEIAITSEPKSESKSFWRIKRSSSLHCENSHKKSSFWSLPLLSRSNSTGSVPNTKIIKSTKVNHRMQNSNKQTRFPTSSSSSFSSQRPPLKKKNGVNYNSNGVRISPILNVPPPIISTNLFGFGSLFSNGKDKKGLATPASYANLTKSLYGCFIDGERVEGIRGNPKY